MKSILIIDDNADGIGNLSINVHHQMTKAELDAGVNPYDTTAGMLSEKAYAAVEQFCNEASARDFVQQIVSEMSVGARQ